VSCVVLCCAVNGTRAQGGERIGVGEGDRQRVAVVNCSRVYNPAVLKLTRWWQGRRGAEVVTFDRHFVPTPLDLVGFDRVLLSVIFSWDLPWTAEVAHWATGLDKAVEIGGPAAELNAAWVERETGVVPWRGRHPCDEVRLEQPRMTWTSRGCVNRCAFCAVPRLEGDLVELDDYDWQPAPLVMDNNFLATSPAHQERVIARLARLQRWVDFNQGLDAHLYEPGFRRLLERYGLRLRVWRFAYDRPRDWPALERALRDLHGAGVNWRNIRVYLLYNYHEAPGAAVERAERVIGNREAPLACPWPMAYKPLDWMGPGEYVAPGWTLQLVRDFRRYYGRPALWGSTAWESYDRRRGGGGLHLPGRPGTATMASNVSPVNFMSCRLAPSTARPMGMP